MSPLDFPLFPFSNLSFFLELLPVDSSSTTVSSVEVGMGEEAADEGFMGEIAGRLSLSLGFSGELNKLELFISQNLRATGKSTVRSRQSKHLSVE